jgi:23S rRNA pseudouridine1911/1915/1917 synthase
LQQWTVSNADGMQRLDAFVAARLRTVPRREIVEWIAAGRVQVNGRPTLKGTQLRPGDVVTVTAPIKLQPIPHLPIRILSSDDTIVVLDKPSGVPSIALRHDETGTGANFLLAYFPETADVSTKALEAGIVHRLDTATSGLLLAARTSPAYANLRTQFTTHTVIKQYVALVEGRIEKQGTRYSHLTPTGLHGQRMREVPVEHGQAARTGYVPIAQFPRHTLLHITIHTGVRHQIRAHLAALGHPIVGDAVYGKPMGDTRLCLHAEMLSFLHPQTGAPVQFTCPLPEDFQAVQKQVASISSMS